MRLNRTANTLRNSFWGLTNNVVGLILPFIIRTIFLHVLSIEYLGLSSLFSSILQMLNLAELGFSSAVVYSMYKPIAENDTDKVCALLALYRTVYRVIGLFIFCVGLILMPFLPLLIRGSVPADMNLYLLFLISLVDTSISYFAFGYKESLLQAHQRTDLTSRVLIVIRCIKYTVQIILLLVFKSYYIYILVTPVATLATNIVNARITSKHFPQYTCRGKLEKREVSAITKQVGGLMISKICGVTRNGLDSIIVSAFIGLHAVAVYGNYYYLIISIHTMLGVITTSMRAGIGNSIACESVEKNYNDMRKFTFLYAWVSGVCTCCFVALYQPFMQLWAGSENMFPDWLMLLFCLYFYIMTVTDIRNVYIDATGIWWQNRSRPIIETIVNFVLNLTLGYFFGVTGIVLATIISMTLINIGYGSKVLFQEYFKGYSIAKYFKNHVQYFIVTVIAAAATWFVCSMVPFAGYSGLVVKFIVCMVVPNAVFLLLYRFDNNYCYVKTTVDSVVGHILKK